MDKFWGILGWVGRWATRQAKDAARAALEKEVRPITNFVQGYQKTTDADRATIGITVRNTSRTPAPAPTSRPLALVESGQDVGSKAVRAFVEKHQPLLTLSGHIHESPDVGKALHGHPTHTATTGRTTCHQPGQELPHRFTYSIVEIDDQCGVPRVRIVWTQSH